MLKELKEQITLEMENLKGELVEKVKTLLNEKEGVYVDLNEDFSIIHVKVVKNNREKEVVKATHYNFTRVLNPKTDEKPEFIQRLFSTFVNNVLTENGMVVGSYTSAVPTELQLIQMVFKAIEDFVASKTAEAKESEEAPETSEA